MKKKFGFAVRCEKARYDGVEMTNDKAMTSGRGGIWKDCKKYTEIPKWGM